MAFMSSPSRARFKSATAVSISRRTSAPTLSPCSRSDFSASYASAVAGLDELAPPPVGIGVGLGVLDHALDLGLGQPAGVLDDDLLLLAGPEVLGRDVDDAVGVDVEGHLDPRHAARRGRDVGEV